MRSELIIEVLPGRLRAAVVSDTRKILARGLFPLEDSEAKTIGDAVKRAQQGLQHQASPLIILPEPGSAGDLMILKPKSSIRVVSSILARAHYEASAGNFAKPGKYILLEVGPHIRMVIIENDKKEKKFKDMDLGKMVANYEELSNPEPEVATLRNYCTESFFINRAKQNSKQLYEQTKNGNNEEADELFVSFGTNLGAFLGFLETLVEPDGVGLTGSALDSYDAWAHAMGKSRNQFQGKKSTNRVLVLRDNPDAVALGGYLYCNA